MIRWGVTFIRLWTCMFLLNTARCAQQSAVSRGRTEWYVSRVTGNDSKACGSQFSPCRTLRHAVRLAGDSNSIYLDGRGTEKHPYECDKPGTLTVDVSEFINKSLSIIGFHERAYLSCDHGLLFETPALKILNVTLDNLYFVRTGTRFVGNCAVSIVNCKFTNCSPLVEAIGTFVALSIRMSVFINNTDSLVIKGSNIPGDVAGTVLVEISDVVLKHNRVEETMIDIESSGMTFVEIRNSLFEENYSDIAPPTLVRIDTDERNIGVLRLINSSFISDSDGIIVLGCLNMYFHNLTFIFIRTALWLAPQSNNHTSEIIVSDCTFSQNILSLDLSLEEVQNITVQIKNTVFSHRRRDPDATLTRGPMVKIENYDLHSPDFSSYQISLKNVTFHSVKGGALLLYFGNGIHKVYVENCLFLNNENTDDYTERWSVIAHIQLPDNDLGTSIYNVYFINTRFEGNTGYFGIVYVQGGASSFVNCTFKDNYVLSPGGGMMCIGQNSDLNVRNGTFLQQKKVNQKSAQDKDKLTSFIYSESNGKLVIISSSFIADDTIDVYPIIKALDAKSFNLDSSSSIRCPFSTTLVFHNVTRIVGSTWVPKTVRTTFQVFCEDCPLDTYSLERGQSTGLIAREKTCQACPYGATCINELIKAKTNFWGYVSVKQPPTLTFIPCPLEYCRPSNSSSIHDYNGCYGHRTGVLCGVCTRGYSEALFSTECREESKCHDNWFWFLAVAYTIMFASYLIIKPPILSFLYRQTFWFKYTPTVNSERSEAQFDPGYLKILFYFYQVAELLSITASKDPGHKTRFLSPVIGLFNFEVRSFNENAGCPLPGLTAVSKEFFLCLKVFATMASVFLIFAIHRAISKTGGLQRPSLTLYLAICMQILLLGYKRLADTSLSLLHCVPIGSERRLFLEGNIRCWQWWQNVLIIYIAVFVAPFIMVLYFGSLQLYRDKVSMMEFLGACVLPLPFLVRWAAKRIKKSSETETNWSDGGEIKKILLDSFRPPTEKDKGVVYWESVLLGRRFVLLCFHSFIADPMTRLLCLDCACVLILVHHIIKKPFRDVKANTCEIVSLLALVTIATFSFAKAAFMSAAVEAVGPNEDHFQVLQWIEVALLGFVPAAFFILVMLAFVSHLCRLVVLVIRGFKKLLYKMRVILDESGCGPNEHRRPLLAPISEN